MVSLENRASPALYPFVATVFAFALVVTACEYKPPASATIPKTSSVFLGYSDPTTKQTTCGTCHTLHQQGWVKTAHSWTATGPLPFQRVDNPNGVGNQDSAGFATDCAWCHTTNGRNSGLAPDTTGWWAASGDAKKNFTDVQCEACHGPGAAHVATPDRAAMWPTGTISSDTGLPRGCSVCHNEADNPYGAQWRTGAHGIVLTVPASQAGCAGCHEGKAVVNRFDPYARFAEQGSSTLYPITCVGCHDPHGTGGQWAVDTPAYDRAWLRAPVDVADLNVNLCMRCHQREASPAPITWREGAHSPQGPMLLGTAGWQPPGFTYPAILPTHASTGNPKLCVGCHMPAWDFITPQGKSHHTPGHRFWAIPCMQADGVTPDTTNTCALTSRNFGVCATSGCHASPATAQTAFQASDIRLQRYLDLLWKDTDGNGVIDAADSGLLPKVPSSEFAVDSVVTVAEGALFNITLMQADGSHGVHNPFYGEALLIATIRAVAAKYGLALPPSFSTQLSARASAIRMAQ